MTHPPFPHSYIAIEGNIGAGKTTLCQMIARDFNCELILEEFTDNPFLPPFYQNPDRYAFPVELFFMTERHKQLQEILSQRSIFQTGMISDYFFLKTLLFAKNNLNEEEYRLFQRLFHVLNSTFPKPDLLVYLHRSVDNLMENIQNRGRDIEKDIEPAYLSSIQNAYFDYFKNEKQIPVLILDVEDMDFQNDSAAYQVLLSHMSKNYSAGLHQVKAKIEVKK